MNKLVELKFSHELRQWIFGQRWNIKSRYKYDGQIPEQLSGELQNCAEQIHALDERMYLIHKVVDMINQSEVDIEQIGY